MALRVSEPKRLASGTRSLQTFLMKLAVSAVVSVPVALVPAVALACPYSEGAGASSFSSFTGYLAAVGVGLAIGVGSVFLERRLRGPKP